jgi:hypothetical protein
MANQKLICMHEQNFEKQVQQKMEELSLTPSAPVWQKVEGQIRKDKDRRRLIFWLLPLLLVGGGAWWLLSGTGGSLAPDAATGMTQQPTTPASAPAQVPASATAADHKDQMDLTPTAPATVSVPSYNPSAIIPSATNRQSGQTARNLTALQETTPPQTDIFTEKEPLVVSKETASGNKETAISKEATDLPLRGTDTATGEVATNTQPVDVPQALKAAPETKLAAPDSSAVVQKAPAKKIRTSKWKWTVHAEAGITSEQSSLFRLPTARTADLAYNGPAQGASSFRIYIPASIKEGSAYSAGITVKRLLGGRTRLTAGLQYNFYSTLTTVGQKADTSTIVPYASRARVVADSYRPGRQTDYRNRYQFIQVPVGIEHQVFRKIPLHLHTGVSLAHLVHTNALLYDTNAQVFYKNNNAFNRTQWHLFTNLTYTLWKGKTVLLNAGPYVQYGLTDLQKTASENSRLFSAGVHTQVSF